MRLRRLSWFALASVLGLACGGDAGGGTTGPEAGTLRVTFVTPNADDGAVMLELIGPVDSISAVAPYQLFIARPSAELTRVIVTGEPADGLLLRLYVPDLAAAGSLGVQVLQVAARTSYLQRPLEGYGLVVQP